MVGLPSVLLFQFLLPLLSPCIDLTVFASLGLWGAARLPGNYAPLAWACCDIGRVVIFFGVFMVVDLLTCLLAFRLEGDEDRSLLRPLLLQSFIIDS